MIKYRITTLIRGLLMLFALGGIAELAAPDQAFARAGGRRSMGRSSQPASRPPAQQPYASPQSQPQRGGFMKGLAGGLAGGFLGSMLFSSIGRASGVGGMGGGGIGLIEIILLAGAAFLLFRWWKNRQMNLAGAGQAGGLGSFNQPQQSQNVERSFGGNNGLADQGAFASSLRPGAVLSTEEASDIFFKVQGAWTRRNLQSIKGLISDDLASNLQRDLDDLIRNRRINRLENISVRQVEVGETWQENGTDLVRMRMRANLLDYTVDEQNGQVIEGSDSEPVKFEEDWIFARSQNLGTWQLVGIQQI